MSVDFVDVSDGMEVRVQTGVSKIVLVLTPRDAEVILQDFDTSKEPSRQGKYLYAALMRVKDAK